ncbi:MAG: glucosaminidase domain-containing protein, partial [Proteobacteria bacterium]|nr:glucosaminidase domain-containing protein [Pseudomonadota bacterium]
VEVKNVTESNTPALISQTVEPFYGWQQADSFVKDLWPHAQKAAEKLGISTKVLVAQSALETGWGKHAMKNADGSVAFNLFGIKASSGWAGQSVTHNTLEFRQGAMQKETANFRAYDSVADSLDDYVAFVKTRARYAQALNHNGSDSHYVKGLQQAGYATDPAYASKINNIMNGQTFKQAVDALADADPVGNRQILS